MTLCYASKTFWHDLLRQSVKMKILHFWRSLLHWKRGQSLSWIGYEMVSSLFVRSGVPSPSAVGMGSQHSNHILIYTVLYDHKRSTLTGWQTPGHSYSGPSYLCKWKLQEVMPCTHVESSFKDYSATGDVCVFFFFFVTGKCLPGV